MGVKFSRTYDQQYIWKCITQPHVLRSNPDVNMNLDMLFPPITDDFIWVRVGKHGVVSFVRIAEGVYDIHLALAKSIWGRANVVLYSLFKWFVSKYQDCTQLNAAIPDCNLRLLAGIKLFSFHEIGRVYNGYVRDGNPGDMIMVTLNKDKKWQF